MSLLRQGGFSGDIVLIGEEAVLPYQRPPLSKAFIGGTLEQPLRDPAFYEEQNVSTRLDDPVVAIDRDARTVVTSTGAETGYDVLVLAPGAAARRLDVPGSHLAGVQLLRTLADARAVRDGVEAGGPVVIVGGGYVGLEVAAVARAYGAKVTVVEREGRILARVSSPTFSDIIERYHRDRGTTFFTGAQVTAFLGSDGRVNAVILDDGTELPCSLALVGVGAVARDELARRIGLECADGILVDDGARTSDPAILAIGDATCRPVHDGSDRMRLESIPSATEQARQAVASIIGSDPRPIEVPWFWSDQFDLKVKIAGIVREPYETILRGDPESGVFALIHHHDGRVVAVETANASGEFMAGKRFLAHRTLIDPVKLADPKIALKTLVPA